MITYDVEKQIGELAKLSFQGLSTDTKPTQAHDGFSMMNGCSFFEMDTQDVYFYDGNTNTWLAQP